jgi:signal transduction histidine kinase
VTSVAYIASPLPRLTLSLLPSYFGAQALGGAAMAILLAGLAGMLLARQLTRPLRCLTDATSALARGDPVSPIPPAGTDELHALGEAFNTMNTNLTAAHDALADQARQREAILDGLADAVVAFDADGEIILTNPAASALLEIASEPLREAIQHTLTCGEPHATEIIARDQVFELLITPLCNEEEQISGAVAVGHDVTVYRQLDRLRTSFVSDVSHELRTPLTAIKGFVETLQDGAAGDPATRDRFLDTVAAETERLIRLTNDLLLLTRADAGRLDLHLTPTDLAAAAERAVAQLERVACTKQIAITVEQSQDSTLVLADSDRIHQVLVNLLDNAIKFTPVEGQVTLSFGRADEQVSCTVADTGTGIPSAEIPHLFERFYRGDRSRARAEGENGSGLGLAIAKAIVEAHEGHLWVESELGQGTSLTFTLPPAP